MISAIIATFVASLLWALTVHIDKFLVNGTDLEGSCVKTLLVFSTLIAGLVFSPIWIILCKFSISISILSLSCIFISSIIYILSTYLYFLALDKNDASIVTVLYQMIPVFSYIFALIFFKENLSMKQIIGAIIIILSAIIISYNFEEKNNRASIKSFILMTVASILSSIYYILFDIAIRNSEYNSCAFWFQIGLFLIGLFLICIKSYRKTFIQAIKNNGKKYLVLNLTNETLNIIAHLLVNFSNVVIPIALANALTGFNGAFVFIIGVFGVIFFPKYFKENLSKKVLIQKISCIVLSIIGFMIMIK